MAVRAVESTPTTVHLALPPRPGDELSDEQLDQVAGGGSWGSAGSFGTLSSVTGTVGTASSAGTASSVG